MYVNIYVNICIYVIVSIAKSHHLFVTPRTIGHQAPLSLGFPTQRYWNGLTFPSPGDLPYLGIKHTCPALQGNFFPWSLQVSPLYIYISMYIFI